ncbi:MAG: cupin domain-containing protein [Caldilineaceae bacterium]|nr:cupin domain-containing protein [Caldilineaceae bacterium]
MSRAFQQLNIHAHQNRHSTSPQYVDLFACEELKAAVIYMPPGSEGEWHVHENSHELFDVVEGEGIFCIEDREFIGAPGKSVLVPAGVRHKLHNRSQQRWTVRVTFQERIYPRHIGKLIVRAIRKRLGIV